MLSTFKAIKYALLFGHLFTVISCVVEPTDQQDMNRQSKTHPIWCMQVTLNCPVCSGCCLCTYMHACRRCTIGSIHQPCSHVHIYVTYKKWLSAFSICVLLVNGVHTYVYAYNWICPHLGNQWDIKDTSCWAMDACLNIFLPPSQQLHMARPLHGCFAMEAEFLYGDQNGALFPMLAMYNEIIPSGFSWRNDSHKSIDSNIVVTLVWDSSCCLFFLPCGSGMNFNKV